MSDISTEDDKLVVLARATRARAGSSQGASLRDLDGRTYAAATVELPSLSLSAVGACVAMAIAGGSKGAEAVVVLGGGPLVDGDVAIIRDFAGPDVPVHLSTASGAIEHTVMT